MTRSGKPHKLPKPQVSRSIVEMTAGVMKRIFETFRLPTGYQKKPHKRYAATMPSGPFAGLPNGVYLNEHYAFRAKARLQRAFRAWRKHGHGIAGHIKHNARVNFIFAAGE